MVENPLLIAIIDDDEIYQFTIIRIIKGILPSAKIVCFADGEEAIDYLTVNINVEANLPDLIFLDNNMPIMDGWQFMEEYSRIENEIKKKALINMVSSSANPVDIEKSKTIQQISEYIVKPIKTDKVKAIINHRISLL
ncbi:MAG: CheY-like chemotaxis protein [Parvicella sp.]|jgi:CheY-like chemotaxis protein